MNTDKADLLRVLLDALDNTGLEVEEVKIQDVGDETATRIVLRVRGRLRMMPGVVTR